VDLACTGPQTKSRLLVGVVTWRYQPAQTGYKKHPMQVVPSATTVKGQVP
jgi:hypothetical protein